MPPTQSPAPATSDPTSWFEIVPWNAFVALFALVFAVASFWVIYYRRGALGSFAPHSFAAAAQSGELLITLPLVFHNDGAAPIVVQDLRLRLAKAPGYQPPPELAEPAQDEPTEGSEPEPARSAATAQKMPEVLPLTLWWRGTQPELDQSPSPRPFPSVFSVGGRSTHRTFIQFAQRRTDGEPPLGDVGGPCLATVEARMPHKKDWTALVTFELLTQRTAGSAQFIVHSNDADWRA